MLAIVAILLWVSLCISQVTEEQVEVSPCGSQCGGHVLASDFQTQRSQSRPLSKNLEIINSDDLKDTVQVPPGELAAHECHRGINVIHRHRHKASH